MIWFLRRGRSVLLLYLCSGVFIHVLDVEIVGVERVSGGDS